jgi:hypothetical protein
MLSSDMYEYKLIMFTFNLTTLWVAQTVQCRVVGCLENNKLKGMWKDTVII